MKPGADKFSEKRTFSLGQKQVSGTCSEIDRTFSQFFMKVIQHFRFTLLELIDWIRFRIIGPI